MSKNTYEIHDDAGMIGSQIARDEKRAIELYKNKYTDHKSDNLRAYRIGEGPDWIEEPEHKLIKVRIV